MDECPSCGLDRIIIELEEMDGDVDTDKLDDMLEDEEGIEMVFQCPICDKEVEGDIDTCPNCGAIFADDDSLLHEELELSDEEIDKELGLDEELELFVEEEIETDDDSEEEDLELSIDDELDLDEELDLMEDTEIEDELDLTDEDDALEPEDLDLLLGRIKEEGDTISETKVTVPDELHEMSEEANNMVNQLKKQNISVDMMEKLLEESLSMQNEGDYDGAERMVLESIKLGEGMKNFIKEADEIKKEIEEFERRGWDPDPLRKGLESAKRNVESGLMNKGFEKLDKIKDEIKEKKQEFSTLSQRKKEINSVVSDLNSILNAAKMVKLPLKAERKLISNALVASKTGDVNKALEWLLKSRDSSTKKIDKQISGELKDLEDRIQDDPQMEKFEDVLLDVRDAKVDGDYTKAADQLKKLKSELAKGYPGEKKKLSVLKDYVNKASYLDIDTDEIEEDLEEAIVAANNGDTSSYEVHLTMVEKGLKKKLPRGLQKIMKKGLSELEEAKEKGESISKAVTHLKQANLMIKKKEYFKALDHMYTFEKLLGKDPEEKKTEVVTVKKSVKKPEKKEEKTITVDRRKKGRKKQSIPSNMEPGSTYLMIEKKPDSSFKAFSKILEQDMRGLCITRQYPVKVKSKYDLGSEVVILWLSNIDQKNAYKPKNLEKLSLEIEKFLFKEKALILLDGLEYLISNNDFRTVFHLIQSLKDQVAVSGSIFIITASPNTLEEHQLDLLETEVDTTYRL